MPKRFLTKIFYEYEGGQDNFRSCNLFNIGKHLFWQEIHFLKSLHVNETVSVVLRKYSHLGQVN